MTRSPLPPDVIVAVEPQQLIIEPGGKIKVRVTIERANGFAGYVPIYVKNLPKDWQSQISD
jgi:hypothetical protein